MPHKHCLDMNEIADRLFFRLLLETGLRVSDYIG